MHAVALFEAHHERHGAGERLAVGPRRLTGAELRAAARRVAAGLAELGVGAGERVGVMLPNGAEAVIAYEAIWRAGAAITPVLPTLTEEELVHVLAHGEPRAFVTDDAGLARVAAARAQAGTAGMLLIGTGALPADVSFAALEAHPHEAPVRVGDASELAALLFTGGTTGRSKGVMLTHGNLVSNARGVAARLALAPGDVCLVSLPLSHAFGLSVLLTNYLERVRLVVLGRFAPETFLDAVAAEGVTITDAVPAILQRLLEHGAGRAELAGLRWVSVGGAPCPVDLIERFEAQTGVRVLESYGLTEATAAVTCCAPADAPRPGSSGRPLDDVEVRILGPDGASRGVDESGEIVVRSPGVMAGYWRDPAGTEAAVRDGWLRTGDIGALDADGFLWVRGRTKELIIRNGFNVHPLDVEEAVRACAGVEDALATGLADRLLGERVAVAFVGDARPADVAEHCRQRLAAHKRPDVVVAIGAIPCTGVGKPSRRALAALLQERAAAEPAEGA